MTDFLQESGFLASPFNLLSSEMNALVNNASAVSTVGGTSGVFTQTNWSSGIWGVAHFTAGGNMTPTTGGYLAAWFLYSPDGTNFEKTVSGTDLPRSPDIIIPMYASSTYGSGEIAQSSGILRLAWWSHKIFIVNHSGATIPSGSTLKGASVAVSY